MSRKRPSFMVHDLLQETEVTFKHWQHKDLFNFQTKKKVLLDDEEDNDVDDDDISTEDIDNFSKLYNNKLNFIHQQYKSNPSSLFDVYKNDWDNCLFNVKHIIPLDKEDLMNTHLLNKTNEKEIFYYPHHHPPPPHHHKNLIKKSRKARTAFTDYQLTELEQSFDRQKYLAVQDRIELASKLNLTDRQVKTWYQNRRTKWKRQTAVGLELMTETENFIAIQHLIEQNPFWAYHPTVKYILSNINPIHKSSSSSTTLTTTMTTTTTMTSTTTTKPITVNISLNNQNSSLVTTEANELATKTTPTISDVGNHNHHHHHQYHQHHQDYKQHLQSTYPRILNALPVRRNSLNDEDHVHIKPSLLCIPSSNNPSFYTKSINLEQLEIRKKSINSFKNQSIINQFIDIQQLWSIIPSLNQSINNEYSNLLPSSSSSSSSSSTSSVPGICCHSLIEGT